MKKINKFIKARINTNNNQKIPRRIIQTHEHNILPERMINAIYTWIDKNPTYDYYFYDKNDRINFIKKYFDDSILKAYNKINHGALQADLFRACYIYINGGVYSDIDQTCINSLDNIIEEDDDSVTGLSRNTPPSSINYINS